MRYHFFKVKDISRVSWFSKDLRWLYHKQFAEEKNLSKILNFKMKKEWLNLIKGAKSVSFVDLNSIDILSM